MKTTVVFIVLFFLAFSAQAENSIVGKWKDKNDPFTYQYEFKESNDFMYTYTWINLLGETQINVVKGVWEIGEWTATSESGNKSSCNLTIYADTDQCCFDYKFVADNLILTNKYKSSNVPMCDNRVLIRAK